MQALYEKLESELVAYLKKMKLKTLGQPSCTSLDGYFSGVSAAETVSLDRQVSSSHWMLPTNLLDDTVLYQD